MFKIGECVLHKLTGEHLLILEFIAYKTNDDSYVNGYYIRRNDFTVHKMMEIELKTRSI